MEDRTWHSPGLHVDSGHITEDPLLSFSDTSWIQPSRTTVHVWDVTQHRHLSWWMTRRPSLNMLHLLPIQGVYMTVTCLSMAQSRSRFTTATPFYRPPSGSRKSLKMVQYVATHVGYPSVWTPPPPPQPLHTCRTFVWHHHPNQCRRFKLVPWW